MPNLEHLELLFAKLSGKGLLLICDGCLNLQYLDLSRCENLRSRDVANAKITMSTLVAADSNSNRSAVQATNDDASASKLSYVKKGYMKDEYINFFVRRPVRRSPIINRGYFARWAALWKLLYQFLDSDVKADQKHQSKKQILSLGAGFDTTYFQLQLH